MNIGEFTGLDREAQFAKAAEIASESGVRVDPSTFDGIWRTESGRGAAMLSPAGAKGHFGLMDNTRGTWEKRFGTTIDPMNFGQSLFTAAHTMKENLGRFKNVPDALRAYNGGWTPATWGNPETAAYAGKVLGGDDSPMTAHNVATQQPTASVVRPASSYWDTPFQSPEKAPKGVKSPVGSAVADLMGLSGGLHIPEEPTFGADQTALKETADADLTKRKLADDTGFLDTARAMAYHGGPVRLLMALNRDPEPVEPGFQVKEDLLKGFDLDEQKELLTATSQKQFDRLKFELEYGHEQDQIAGRNGTVFGLAAGFLAAAPEAILSGGLATLAIGRTAVGSIALAQRGQKLAALGSSFGEGVAGNVINTAALDMLGDRQGVNAYALGVAGGLLNPIMSGRYLGRTADKVSELRYREATMHEAAQKEAVLETQARFNLEKNNPGGEIPREELKAEMDRLEAKGIRADIASHRQAIPETRKMNVGDEADLAEAQGKTAATAEGPMDDAKALNSAVNELGSEKVIPRWESPDFQAKRIERVTTDAEWSKDFGKMTGGMDYATASALPTGVHLTPDMQAAMASSLSVRNSVQAVMDLASEYLPGGKIVLHSGVTDSGKKAGARGQIITAGDVHAIGIDVDNMRANPTGQNHTAFHELGHAIYHQHAPAAPPSVLASIANEWSDFASRALKGDVSARGDRLAVTHPSRFDEKPLTTSAYALSKDEYMAEQFVQHLQNRLISGKYGKLSTNTINQVINGVKAVLNYVKELVGIGKVKPGKAADDFFNSILEGGFNAKKAGDELLAPELRLPEMDEMAASSDLPEKLSKEVNELINDPVAMRHGLDRLPMGTPAERAEAKQILNLYKKAESPEYAVDEKRLSKLLNMSDSLNPTSNMMLRSKNPVVRMAAIELLENGGGAAGRRSTASIAKWMNERAIIGDSIVKLDLEFKGWFKGQPDASNMIEAFTGRKRAQFDRLVAEEVEQRRYPGQQTDFGQSVRNAADTIEGSFERARLMQTDAKTAGWAALPESSRGYMPHRIKSQVYRNLTVEQKRALHAELTDQFVTVSEFDPTFADQLASRYLDRTEQRALGGFDAPMGMHQVGASDMIREAMEQMGLNRQEVDQMMKRHVAGAAAHTKKRLNIDLRKTIASEDGSTFTLLDLYDTDMLSLLRGQSQRVSGEVALARHGVMGKPGLAIMRRAMGYGGTGEQAVAKEVGAFDQVSAEFLGAPFGDNNKWVDRAIQFNSVSSLGGMGFNQLGEQINVGATLGVKAALQIVPEFGRIRAEVLAKATGKVVKNDMLDSLEFMGGAEFGTDAYKMVFPMDNPELFNNSMGADSITGADRLMRGAGHLQSKLSLWRTIHSTQTRFVAEQIVLKAAKAMKTGANDFHMRDMGISDEVFAALKKDIGQIATMKDGRITGFDITKATDKDAANQFIQAVHRGGSQIIQGTFIGENGKYVHNSWLRMLTQFRSFSLTAIDKQWNRQVGNRGISGAVLVTIAAMSAAVPIYLARTYAASIGRADREEYLAKHTSFGAIARATTNYIATAGLAGDFLDAATAVTGTGEFTGGRSGTATTATGMIPVAGKVDKVWGAVQNTKDGTDPHALIKELPLSRLPFFIPAINALSD